MQIQMGLAMGAFGPEGFPPGGILPGGLDDFLPHLEVAGQDGWAEGPHQV
jgi:hypothetical protein